MVGVKRWIIFVPVFKSETAWTVRASSSTRLSDWSSTRMKSTPARFESVPIKDLPTSSIEFKDVTKNPLSIVFKSDMVVSEGDETMILGGRGLSSSCLILSKSSKKKG